MKRKFHLVLTNPLTLILPVVVILAIAWRHYTYAGLSLSVPEPNGNVLPNSNFVHQDSDGKPSGWQIQKSGNITLETGYENGYVNGETLKLSVTEYSTGDVTLLTPKVTVHPEQTYLFKGYYRASTPFVLLARYYYRDGSNTLNYLQDYLDSSGTWSTVSDAFATSDNIVAVQYVYKLTSAGWLKVNGTYLESKRDVYIAPDVGGQNTIPNSQLAAASDSDMPDQWTTYHSGNNTSAFTYGNTGSNASLKVTVSDYKDGEAKWQYEPQPVAANHYYRFGVSYKSDVPAQIVAEYVMQDGHREFATIATLAPADEWTKVTYPIEIPPGASTLFVSVLLKKNGTLATRDYTLLNLTKPGATQWKRPLVSLAFDDGWQSAYTDAVPALKRNSFKATFYINPSSIETSGFMTAAELHALAGNDNEIAAHGYAHDDMTAIDEGELDYQLSEGRDYLRKAGFSATNFATPYGASDAQVEWYARKYFNSLRGTETGLNTRQNFDPYSLRVLYVDSNTSKDTVANALLQAKLYNGWLILVYHRFGNTVTPKTLKVEDTVVTNQAFAAQMSLVKRSGIAVTPVASALSEVQKQ